MTQPIRITRTRFELRPEGGGPPVRGDVRVAEGTEPRDAVVICHGFKGFREASFFPALAGAVAARGHTAVSFDFSHNGVGADGVDFSALELFAEQTHSRNVDEIRMVLGALGGILPREPRHVGLFGHSRGGGEAALAAAEDGRVDALVTWAAIASVYRWSDEQMDRWRRGETVEIVNTRTGQPMPVGPAYLRDLEANTERLDIRRAAAKLRAPWLIVHGEADTSVPADDSRALWDMAGENAELLLIEDADHTFGSRHPYPGATDALRTATEATLDWFGTHLA
ncbi:MAG TPA: dienelactone hydrolase family protein [Longimicrobium sp.]|nr:dienelactone hydrolase family protein [Longimicrobium sp.]